MPTIHIKKQHNIDTDTVKKEVQNLADKLSKELSAEYQWKGNQLEFKRTGANGHIDIHDNEVDVEIKLGLALTPLKRTIETKINDYLDERLS
ncbi:MAG: polyhydroxyalkanoic acid system family protein [Gammaproteobacteria bacterium]|nr:polyhydroxyalkanoic acid system family protein [Gammaproteobacteria bacterium]